ncbi:MAG: hypothetical protein R2705_05020 [Ilumatobacteraceae bacterium]
MASPDSRAADRIPGRRLCEPRRLIGRDVEHGYLGYILRRLLQLIPLLFGVVLRASCCFGWRWETLQRSSSGHAPDEQVADKRAELGLDESLPQQFLTYAGGLVQGDFGQSIRSRRPSPPSSPTGSS